MDWMKVLYSFISVGALGALLGLGLALASKALAVKKDKKIEELENALPGLNCGACGYAGCSSYAEALASGEDEDLNKCGPGGSETVRQLGEILDADVDVSGERQIPRVHCGGGRTKAVTSFEYHGIRDCNAAVILYSGDKECKFGCLGLGSCISVCPVEAIDYNLEGLVEVDPDKCISCGKCVDVCPTAVMKWVPESAVYIVACNSTDKGGKVKKYCQVGCIGCKICEKKSPEGGFIVENFLASIDYSQAGERTEAADSCPAKCIVPVRQVQKVEK